MIYQTADESHQAGVTYHLVPAPLWLQRGGEAEYLPESFDADGFIHCTSGLEPLRNVGNMFYTGDTRDYLVLVIDVTKITSEVRYDDPERIYPHIYSPLNAETVIGLLDVERSADGTFIKFTER